MNGWKSSQFRKRGGSDTFDPNDPQKTYYVCEFHFKAGEIRVSLGTGRKTIITGKVPSVFEFRKKVVKERKPPKERTLPCQPDESEPSSDIDMDGIEEENVDFGISTTVDEITQLRNEKDQLLIRIKELELRNNHLEDENIFLKSTCIYSCENISRDPEHFRKCTGLEVDTFQHVFDYLDPGEDCCNLNRYDYTKKSEAADIEIWTET